MGDPASRRAKRLAASIYVGSWCILGLATWLVVWCTPFPSEREAGVALSMQFLRIVFPLWFLGLAGAIAGLFIGVNHLRYASVFMLFCTALPLLGFALLGLIGPFALFLLFPQPLMLPVPFYAVSGGMSMAAILRGTQTPGRTLGAEILAIMGFLISGLLALCYRISWDLNWHGYTG
jgi:hypothetical protein